MEYNNAQHIFAFFFNSNYDVKLVPHFIYYSLFAICIFSRPH